MTIDGALFKSTRWPVLVASLERDLGDAQPGGHASERSLWRQMEDTAAEANLAMARSEKQWKRVGSQEDSGYRHAWIVCDSSRESGNQEHMQASRSSTRNF